MSDELPTIEGEIPFCPGCLARDSVISDREVRHKREVTALRNQAADKWLNAKEYPDEVNEVLTHWRLVCRGPNSESDISLDGDRAKLVRRLLKAREDDKPIWPVERLKRVADGGAAVPYVGKLGWRPRKYPGAKRKNDATYLYRDASIAEQFEGYALWHQQREVLAGVQLELVQPPFDLGMAAVDMVLDALTVLDRAGIPSLRNGRSLSFVERVQLAVGDRSNVLPFERKKAA